MKRYDLEELEPSPAGARRAIMEFAHFAREAATCRQRASELAHSKSDMEIVEAREILMREMAASV